MSIVSTFVVGWNKYIQPLYNWIPANIQALWWIKHRKEGHEVLETLEKAAPNHKAIQNFMSLSKWAWMSDPLGGVLDYTSKPWVICAKKGGDCDDFAELWHYLLKPHGDVEFLITGKRYTSFHKMTIFTTDGASYLLSNLKLFRMAPEENKKDLYDAFYGDDTWFSAVY